MKSKIILWILIFWVLSFGVSFAYAPFKSGWTCNFPKSEDPDGFWKKECENEMSFSKFTETTGTRTMSTTCCWYEEHYPEYMIRQAYIDAQWWAEKLIQENKFDEVILQANEEIKKMSASMWQLHDLLLKLSIQVYDESHDKQSTYKTLSEIFKICTERQKNIKVRAVCGEFYYDLIWTNPKLSKITFDDVNSVLKKENKIIKRWHQYSDQNEIFEPINYPYSSVRNMYMIWDYAFGLWDAFNYFNDHWIDTFGILVMKAGDTHRQKFADISLPTDSESSHELRLWFNNHKLSLYIPIREQNTAEEKRLTSQYELQNDWSWKLVWCLSEAYKNNNPYEWITQKKISLTKCQNLSNHVIGVETVLWN